MNRCHLKLSCSRTMHDARLRIEVYSGSHSAMSIY